MQSLFQNCVLWFPGYDTTTFPIIPSGVTATPNGTFSNDLTMPNGKKVKTFDGSTNYISLTDNDNWDIYTSNFTITLWIKLKNISSTQRLIGQSVDNLNRTLLQWMTGGYFNFFSIVSSTSRFDFSVPLVASIDTWYYVTIVRSGSVCLAYINASPVTVTTTTAFSATATTLAAPYNIGRGFGASYDYSNCNIKDLMIYNGRALTQPEILLIMQRTNPSNLYNFQPAGGYFK